MLVNVYTAEQGKNQRQSRQTKHLKVDPDILRHPERDIDIRQSAENKEYGPGNVQSRPYFLRQGDFFAQHALNQRFVHDPLAEEQGTGKQAVNYRNLPFDKFIVMEEHRQATKHGN